MTSFVSPCSFGGKVGATLNHRPFIDSKRSTSSSSSRFCTAYRLHHLKSTRTTTRSRPNVIRCEQDLNDQHNHLQESNESSTPSVKPTSAAVSDDTATTSTEASTSPQRKVDYELREGEIGVRFINSPLGHDVIAAAAPNAPLLNVGDSVGVSIPRACKTGLCGSCTVDVLDSNAENGRQTIRACQAGALIPDDGVELVVDVERMKTFKGKPKDPMKRFENLDFDYVAGAAPGSGSGGGASNTPVDCRDCNATGHVLCYNCEGTGFEEVDDTEDEVEVDSTLKYRSYQSKPTCLTCVGMKELRCATCQGTGQVVRRR